MRHVLYLRPCAVMFCMWYVYNIYCQFHILRSVSCRKKHLESLVVVHYCRWVGSLLYFLLKVKAIASFNWMLASFDSLVLTEDNLVVFHCWNNWNTISSHLTCLMPQLRGNCELRSPEEHIRYPAGNLPHCHFTQDVRGGHPARSPELLD
jgi:hypothetical protein